MARVDSPSRQGSTGPTNTAQVNGVNGLGVPRRPKPARRRTLQDSFSAVSKLNFASKYAFESSRRDLHNALESNPPHSFAQL